MSNQNLQIQIRQGLSQYVGAILNNAEFSSQKNRQLAVAALCEEAIKIITDDGSQESVENKFFIDDYACKPFLRGMKFLLSRNLKRMKTEISDEIPELVEMMKQTAKVYSGFDKKILDSWIGKGDDN